jgi:Transposase DDE domain
MPQIASVVQPTVDADIVPPSDSPIYREILDWLMARLRPAGLSIPLCKRLAVTISGLVTSKKATIGDLSTAIEALLISPAKDESIARRLQRTLQDARLDPSVLPLIFRPLLPELLHNHLLAHAANAGSPALPHARFVGVVIVFDESSQRDYVHLAVAGVPIGGVVLPLAMRTWQQNAPLPEGEYWTLVTGLLQEIQEMLPAQLRAHVLLTADRLYGVPRMLDILTALGWNWLLRVQGQTQVRQRNGVCCPLRLLVPKPGTQWSSGFGDDTATEAAEAEPVGVFKAAGWRRSQVVAVWAEGQAEPWLLLTSLTAKTERVAEYAQRWAIERLFLSWKSHGWDIEASGIHDPERLGRLLTGMALATLWRLAMALPTALNHLADLVARVGGGARQLCLPGLAAAPRPWAAKFSLLTWGAKVAQSASLCTRTPALCWRLPYWEGRTWKDICRYVHLTTHGQFPISP